LIRIQLTMILNTIKQRELLFILFLLVFTLNNTPSTFADNWYKGDLHVHTELSSKNGNCDQESLNSVGFSIEQIRTHLHSADYDDGGIWISITDHSYCLNANEWNNIIVPNSQANSGTFWDEKFLFMPSEELSVQEDSSSLGDETLCYTLNSDWGSAGHLGAQGISSFIEQDDTEWCPEWPDAQESIINVIEDNGIAIINHPYAKEWDWESLGIHGGEATTVGETGIEIWNENFESDDQETFNLWKDHLLDGDKIYAFGGSDSHEPNTGVPFWPITAEIGDVWNYADVEGTLTSNNLKDALKNGRNTVSNNGLLYIELKHKYSNNQWYMQGSTVDVCYGDSDVEVKATYEGINHPCKITIYKGVKDDDQEYHQNTGLVSGDGSWSVTFPIDSTKDAYVRAECISDDGQYRIYTNPVFIDVDQTDNDGDGACSSYDGDDDYSGSSPTSDEICDGFDNDQDGQTDEGGVCAFCQGGEITLQGCKQKGVCGGSYKSCVDGQFSVCNYPYMYESEETTCDNKDNDCDGNVDEGCSNEGYNCNGDDSDLDCEVATSKDVLMYDPKSGLSTAYPLVGPSLDASPICGWDYCFSKEVYSGKFDLGESDCSDDNLDAHLDWVYDADLSFWNIEGKKQCDNTRLFLYNLDEDDLDYPEANGKDLGKKSNWEYIDKLTNCYEYKNTKDIGTEFVVYTPIEDEDTIALAWWPDSDQSEWWIALKELRPVIDINYCKPCSDKDSDSFSPSNSDDCGTDNDCDDNNANIYPENNNPFCNCDFSDGYLPNQNEVNCDNYDDDCDGTIDEGCDDDGDNVVDETMGGTDTDDTNPSINENIPEDCTDGIDNDDDGQLDCADLDCNNMKCGLCKICSSNTCSGTPSDDGACGTIDCNLWYEKAGQQGPTSVENCFNKQDLETNRCNGFGACKQPNTASACASQPNDKVKYTCGSCKYIDAGSCTGTTLGTCSNYGTSTQCSTSYLCSDSAGGDNKYGLGDLKVPSLGFCDGSGSCDYSSSTPVCSYASNVEGTAYSSICTNGQSTCINSCTDTLDNDNDEKIDCADPDCGCPVIIISINVNPSNSYTDDILDCMFMVSGPEPIVVDVTWYKNNEPWSQDNENDIPVVSGIIAHTTDVGDIEAIDTTKDEGWKCSANAYSQATTQESGWVTSENVIILNTPPIFTTSEIVLNSTFGTNMSNESLIVYPKNSFDIDNDPIENITNWKVNGIPVTVLNLPLISSKVNGNYNWTYDFSGYHNDGKFIDKPHYLNKGIINGSFEFTDANDAITIQDSNTLDVVNNYSIEIWLNWTGGVDDTEYIIKKPEAYYIAINSTDGIVFGFWNSTEWVEVGYRFGIQTNVLTHIIARWDGTDKKLFINGTELAFDYEPSSPVASNYDIYIGQDENGNNQFNGIIDEIKIYNRSLSPEQINKIYMDITAAEPTTPYDTFVSQETKVGDVWQAEVTPYDGNDTGGIILSNTLTILEVCYEPYDNMFIGSNIYLCSGVYNITDNGDKGILIPTFDDIIIRCGGTWINGSHNGIGLLSNWQDNITITGCTFSDYNYGAYLYQSNNFTFENNSFYSNELSGIYINTSDETNITNNTFKENEKGINIITTSSDKNLMWKNLFFGNTTHKDGIYNIGTSSLFCKEGVYGNYYDFSVGYVRVSSDDCGPTPHANITLYDKSDIYNWSWGGATATYNNLREAIYNTQTNRTINVAHYSGTYYSNDSDTIRDNITLNCNGTIFDGRANGEIGVNFNSEKGWIIKNCTFIRQLHGIYFDGGSHNNSVANTSISSSSYYGIYLNGDENNVTNNTFYNNTNGGVYITNLGQNNNVYSNFFLGNNNDGTKNEGVNTNLCINNNYGNYYSEKVPYTNVPWQDCGPTPNGNVKVYKKSERNNFTWGGVVATYINLQEAFYNTYNSSYNKIIVLVNSGPYYNNDTNTVRDNIYLDCNKNTFDGRDDGKLIYFRGEGHNLIRNCTVQNYDSGLYLNGTNYNLIHNNTFYSNDLEGVYTTSSDYNEIINNSFTDNGQEGVEIGDVTSNENKIGRNTFSAPNYYNTKGVNDKGISTSLCEEVGNYHGTNILNMPSKDCGPIPNGTLVVNKNVEKIIDWDANVVLNNLGEGIRNTNFGRQVNISKESGPYSEQTVAFSKDNVTLHCHDVILDGLDTYQTGLIIMSSNGITIKNCTIQNFDEGIYIFDSDYSNIFNSTFTSINSKGIHLYGDVRNITIKHNNFSFNNQYGLYIYANYAVSYVNITENHFEENTDYAIYVNSNSLNTKIWRNNFIYNNNGGIEGQAYNDEATSLIDINNLGNYWTDYDEIGDGCIDDNSDGFCDSPQTNITGTGGISDNYPYVNKIIFGTG